MSECRDIRSVRYSLNNKNITVEWLYKDGPLRRTFFQNVSRGARRRKHFFSKRPDLDSLALFDILSSKLNIGASKFKNLAAHISRTALCFVNFFSKYLHKITYKLNGRKSGLPFFNLRAEIFLEFCQILYKDGNILKSLPVTI
jgi:hypothetical protein